MPLADPSGFAEYPDVLIGCNHDVESCFFRGFQKVPVLKLTFLSNRMRNAVSFGVSQNRLDLIGWNLELFGDVSDA